MATQQKKYIVIELMTRGGTKEVEKSITRVVNDLRSYEHRLKEVNKEYKLQKALLDDLKRAASFSKKQGLVFDKTQLNEAQKSVNRLNREYKQLSTNVQSNKRAFSEYKGDMIGATNANKDQAQSIENVVVRLGAMVIAYQKLKQALSFAIGSFVNFEYSLMNVQTLLNETDRTLQRGAYQVMRDYGFAINDVNKALFDAISAMIPARSSIQFLNDAARLAVGGVTDLKTAVDGLTSIINAYNLNVSEASRVADAFFRAQKWGKTTVQDMVENIGRLAPVASIAGISYQEMLATLSELTLVGLDTRESVTVLRQAIAALIKPAAHAEAALRKYNVPVGVAEVSTAGLAYSLERLMEAYEEFPDIISEMIPNIRAFTGVTALNADRLKHLRMVTKDVTENWGEMSSLSGAFARQMSTTEMKTRKFRGELSALGVEIGSKFKNPLDWMLRNFKEIGATIVSLVAGLAVFAFKMVALPKIIAAVSASLIYLRTAAGAATAGLSLVVGILVSRFIFAQTKIRDFQASIVNLTQQVNSAKKAFSFMVNELDDVLKSLDKTTPGTDKYAELLKRKGSIINEINTNYGEYLRNLISDKVRSEDLNEVRAEGNKLIETNLALRNKQAAYQKIEQDLTETTRVPYEEITKEFRNKFKESVYEMSSFYFKLDMLLADYSNALQKLYEGGDLTKDKMKELREELEALIGETLKKLFNAAERPVITRQINKIVDAYENFARALADVNLQMVEYNKLIEESREYKPTTIRERTPHQMMMDAVVGPPTAKQKTIWDFMKEKDELPEEFSQYKKGLMQEYQKLFLELKKTIEEGKDELGKAYAEMTPAERYDSKRLTELELQLTDLYKRIQSSLKDAEIQAINEYNFYTRSALDYSKALDDKQMKSLVKSRRDWWQQLRKQQNDHNRLTLNMQLSHVEDEINAYETGYTKELLLLHSSFARKLVAIETGYEAQKEAVTKKMEDLQILDIDYNNKKKVFEQMLLDLETEYNVQKLNSYKQYQYDKKKISNRLIEDLKDFRLKYIKENDQFLRLQRDFEVALVSMANDLRNLIVDQELADYLYQTTDITKENIENILEELDKFDIRKMSIIDMNNLLSVLAEMADSNAMAWEAFAEMMVQYEFSVNRVKTAILDNIGILTQEDRAISKRIELEKKLHDEKTGLLTIYLNEARAKKGNVELTKEETEAVEAQVAALEDLARKINEVNISSEALSKRRPTGNVTYGEIYQDEVKKYEVQLELKEITQEDFDNAIKVLDREYPKWLQKMTESGYEKFKAITDRVTSIVSNAINQIFQMQADADQRQYQRQMEMLYDQNQTELDLLKNRLDKGLLSEDRYQKEKEKIDQKYRKREEEEKRRQFEREKKRAAAQAIIQGAVAAVRAYAELGPIGGWVGAALVAAETALQVGLIYAQKYKKGGLFEVGGRKHGQGGTKFFGSDGSVFEAELGELIAIVNANDSEMINALGTINSFSGKKFGSGGIHNDGGRFQRDIADSISGAFNHNKLVEALKQMPPPVVSVEEIQRKSDRLVKVKDAARM